MVICSDNNSINYIIYINCYNIIVTNVDMKDETLLPVIWRPKIPQLFLNEKSS